ncbi:hypothetical protein ABKV19_010737 [Rosa sericea]
MFFRTVLFLFFATILVTTRVSADEFENEKAMKPKTPTPGDLHAPPLSVDKVYSDQKQGLGSLASWLVRIARKEAEEKAKEAAIEKAKETAKEAAKKAMESISGDDDHSP